MEAAGQREQSTGGLDARNRQRAQVGGFFNLDPAVKIDHRAGKAVQVFVLGVGVIVVAGVLRVAGLQPADGFGRCAVGVPEGEVEGFFPRELLVLMQEGIDLLEEVDSRRGKAAHFPMIANPRPSAPKYIE